MLKTKSLLTIPIALALGLTLAGPATGADDEFAGPSKAITGQVTDLVSPRQEAKNTLAEVKAIARGDAAKRDGRTTDGRSLTVALRDLKVQMQDLSPADRKTAQQLLQRPGDPCGACDPDENIDNLIDVPLPESACQGVICVHYTTVGNDAPSLTDGGDAGTTPDYIDEVLATTQQVHADYVAAGYKRPKPDGAIGGGNDVVDIYIGDIGDDGLYGYCTSDDPNNPNQTGDYSVWAYCTLDDDYDASEFPTNTPLENMRVTAAHEYFHAVQYAYDAYEDGWILESTATWVEDEMFDGVDDNRNYLNTGPLAKPGVPIDTFGDGFHYGTWIFWRYLTEKFPAKTGKLPKLVLDVWKRLEATPGADDDYSTQGLAKVLNNRGTSIKSEIIKFHAANRRAKKAYSEGNAYKNAPAALTFGLPANKAKAGFGQVFHMASATVRFNPKKLTQKNWKLRLTFDLPPTSRGSSAVVVVYRKNGKVDQTILKLNKQGNASKTVPFSTKSIAGVDAIMVNSSTRFGSCFQQQSPYSCSGIPTDDPKNENELIYKVTGRTVK